MSTAHRQKVAIISQNILAVLCVHVSACILVYVCLCMYICFSCL